MLLDMENFQQDKEANQFAMEILIPKFMIDEEVKKGIDISNGLAIHILAKKFKVEENILMLRLFNLGYSI